MEGEFCYLHAKKSTLFINKTRLRENNNVYDSYYVIPDVIHEGYRGNTYIATVAAGQDSLTEPIPLQARLEDGVFSLVDGFLSMATEFLFA